MSCRQCKSWEEESYFCMKHLKARTPNNHCGDFKHKDRKCKTCHSGVDGYCHVLDKPCSKEHTGCSHYKSIDTELQEHFKQMGW